jgi:ACS family D-galactonate transporter-like MFS transporter
VSVPRTAKNADVSSGVFACRWGVLSLLAIGTMFNFLDRTVLGVAAPALSAELKLTPELMGVVLSAFSWSYAAAQLPGGWFLDRFGNKVTYFLAVIFWSLFTVLQGLASGLVSLVTFRLGLGLSESPCFPVNSRVVAEWFPERERARATAVYTLGEYVGLACFGPALFWVLSRFGWRTLFYLVGAAGIGFGMVWWALYREPHPRPGAPASRSSTQSTLYWAGVRRLLGFRQVWGASIGQFGGNSTLVFFLTWFPTYLARERHMDWIRSGFFAVLPYFAAGCGVLVGGWLSDRLLRQGRSLSFARKLPVIVGLLGSSTIILANYASSDTLVIAVLSAAFFAQGMTGLGWAVISEIAPVSMMGLTGGIFNFAANVAGILTPLVIGFILGATGSFYWALAYVGAMALIGALSYIFLLGQVERIDLTAVPE